MPSNRDIVGRFLALLGLFGELKGRQDWTTKISVELLKLWEKMNFPFCQNNKQFADLNNFVTFTVPCCLANNLRV